jgi:hypothetical protein
MLLRNMYDPKEVNLNTDPTFYSRMRSDVSEFCKKYGEVHDVIVDGSIDG